MRFSHSLPADCHGQRRERRVAPRATFGGWRILRSSWAGGPRHLAGWVRQASATPLSFDNRKSFYGCQNHHSLKSFCSRNLGGNAKYSEGRHTTSSGRFTVMAARLTLFENSP